MDLNDIIEERLREDLHHLLPFMLFKLGFFMLGFIGAKDVDDGFILREDVRVLELLTEVDHVKSQLVISVVILGVFSQ